MPELNDDDTVRIKVGDRYHVPVTVCRRRCVSAGLYVASIVLGFVAGFLFARVCDALAWNLGGWL